MTNDDTHTSKPTTDDVLIRLDDAKVYLHNATVYAQKVRNLADDPAPMNELILKCDDIIAQLDAIMAEVVKGSGDAGVHHVGAMPVRWRGEVPRAWLEGMACSCESYQQLAGKLQSLIETRADAAVSLARTLQMEG